MIELWNHLMPKLLQLLNEDDGIIFEDGSSDQYPVMEALYQELARTINRSHIENMEVYEKENYEPPSARMMEKKVSESKVSTQQQNRCAKELRKDIKKIIGLYDSGYSNIEEKRLRPSTEQLDPNERLIYFLKLSTSTGKVPITNKLDIDRIDYNSKKQLSPGGFAEVHQVTVKAKREFDEDYQKMNIVFKKGI